MSCCACQEAEATIFRDCGHHFCGTCVLEFMEECREDYCKSSTLLKIDLEVLREQSLICEEEIVQMEMSMVQKLEAMTVQSDRKLEEMITRYNEQAKVNYNSTKADLEKNIAEYAQIAKQLQASQSVAESMEGLRDLPLAASAYDRYLAAKQKFYRVSQLEQHVEPPEARYRFETVENRGVGFVRFIVKLWAQGKLRTAWFDLEDYGKILSPFKTEKAYGYPGNFTECHIAGVSRDGEQTAFFASPKNNRRCLLMIVDRKLNISMLECRGAPYDRFLRSSDFDCGTRAIKLFGKFYSIGSQNPVYIHNDLPNYCISTSDRVPAPDCYVLLGILNGTNTMLRVPR